MRISCQPSHAHGLLIVTLAGQVVSLVLIAIILVATALGSVVPLLEDRDKSASDFGQLIITAAMFAEFDSIILLWLFFV